MSYLRKNVFSTETRHSFEDSNSIVIEEQACIVPQDGSRENKLNLHKGFFANNQLLNLIICI